MKELNTMARPQTVVQWARTLSKERGKEYAINEIYNKISKLREMDENIYAEKIIAWEIAIDYLNGMFDKPTIKLQTRLPRKLKKRYRNALRKFRDSNNIPVISIMEMHVKHLTATSQL